ncbi:MAG: guanylate kinase [Proteobacteria bacterium]|nr:guanylate kinase [Pseudomonadota bacterium]MCP4920669.1 guanylate kinase [Pseudomonadota bacterium]
MSPLVRWSRPDTGALFVVTGASGSGKTTLLREAFEVIPDLAFSVSATTRDMRQGEVDGRDYHFVQPDRFDELLAEDALLEWARVYDNRYGTPRRPVVDALARGQSIVLDIDAQGAAQVRESFPQCVSVFILPASIDVLETRLRARGTDSDAIIRRRMDQVHEQIGACGSFDYLVVNDDLATAHRTFQAVFLAELQRRSRRPSLVDRFANVS